MVMRYYLGVAEEGPNNWSISFPALPGVVTTGETFGELVAHASDAIASAIEAMQEDGIPIPGDIDGAPDAHEFNRLDYTDPCIVMVGVEAGGRALRINVTMDEALVARLDRQAERMHATRSSLLALGARMVLAREMLD